MRFLCSDINSRPCPFAGCLVQDTWPCGILTGTTNWCVLHRCSSIGSCTIHRVSICCKRDVTTNLGNRSMRRRPKAELNMNAGPQTHTSRWKQHMHHLAFSVLKAYLIHFLILFQFAPSQSCEACRAAPLSEHYSQLVSHFQWLHAVEADSGTVQSLSRWVRTSVYTTIPNNKFGRNLRSNSSTIASSCCWNRNAMAHNLDRLRR